MTPDPIVGSLAKQVLAGDARAVARAITLVEDEGSEGEVLIAEIFSHSGRAYLVGITGPPGAGKSTLVNRLIAEVRRAGQTVGVVAVDPSSPFTGGAVLGDRVRMTAHAADEGVFVRSMATRGQLGGLARASADAALVLDAAGRDVVFLETVGVGQDEVEIAGTADLTVVVLAPGAGDDVQVIKAGIMEIGDIFVVNKADRGGADRVVASIEANLSLQSFAPGEWRPLVLEASATTGAGVGEVWAAIGRFRRESSAARDRRRRARHEGALRGILSQRLVEHVERDLAPGEFQRLVDEVASRRLDPYSAADRITDVVFANPEAQTPKPEPGLPSPSKR